LNVPLHFDSGSANIAKGFRSSKIIGLHMKPLGFRLKNSREVMKHFL